uniref:Uncharacterized protein n=1 Tax=Eptatretus burgeri TaxID=7764 RepID=A0A8C4NGZ2_EPTBU
MHVHSHGEPQIASGSPLAKSDDLACLWHFLSEPAVRAWQVFLGQERKQSAKADQHMASARRARFWVMGSFGFIKLSSKQRHKAGFKPKNRISLQDAAAWTLTHIAVVRDLVESRFNQWEEGEQSIQNMLEEEWTDMEADLLRERGLWGPSVGSRLDKWQLEPCEGPCRMRRRLVPNNTFYSLYPYHSEEHESDVNRNEYSHNEDQTDFHKINGSTKAMNEYDKEDCTCLTSSEHTVIRGNDGDSHITDLDALDEHEDSVELEGLAKLDLESMAGDEDATSEGLESEAITEDLLVSGRTSQTNYLAVQYLLEDGEKVSHMFRYARVEGLDTREGILLFGKENFYLIDGVTVTEEGELCQIDLFPSELYEPVLPWVTRPRALTFQHRSSRFPYESLREVHRWRYLLQPIAVEVFLSDGQTFMLAFSRGIRNKVFQRFLTMAPSLADSSESVSGQNPNASVEAGSGLLGNLVGAKSVTQRWVQGEISNFQYLMHLNTLAGRSYNDLMQYPVFPWILADYDSEELNLKDPATFRDLSKPMGAQTERRLQQFVKRFQEWEDPHGDTSAYHYGTHYSSAMIVAFYLVRMEPFAQTFLRLQGGHFDLADRMFHSIRDTWLSASCNNMADVKELIPEFFYLPEFLRNDNNFNLGCKQNGTRLADVVLPPWAKGDVHKFICVHRQALECDYVSSNLHRWIDLIFGYKQRGPDSVPAANVFHPLFYEGSVDLHNIQDQLQLTATIGFINNFGQIPTQLFKKPHPMKHVCESRGGIYFHQQHVPFVLKQLQLKELHGPVGQIVSSERGVLAVEQHKVLIPPAYQRSLAWGFADLSCHISQYESDKVLAVFECLWDWGPLLCAVCPSARTIICGGTATVLCIFEICVQRDHKPSLKLKQVLHGHTAAVTCLAVSQVFHLLVSGSRDCTCILWDMNSPRFLTQLRGHTAPVSAVCVSELTGKIVTCAGSDVFLWSINGEPLAWASCALGPPILCCCFAEIEEWDTDNKVVTGHADGVLQMWRCEYQQVLNDAVPKEVRIGFEHEKHSTVSEVSAEAERGQEDNNSSDSDNLLEISQPPSMQDTEGSTENNCGKQSSVILTGRVNDVSDSGLSIEPVASAERDGFHLHSYAASEEASPSEPMDSTSNILLSETGGSLETPSRNCGEECHHHSREESHNMNRESGRQSPLSKQAFQWERQLVLSRKIHIFKSSAYEQASITALALSRDHNCLLLGDSCGRVFSCTGSTRKKRGENK